MYVADFSTYVEDFVPRLHNIHKSHFWPTYHNEECIQLFRKLVR